MTKLPVTAALLATVGVACTASAQAPPQAQTIVRAGAQPSTQGPEQYFSGKVRVDPVFAASADMPYSAAYVTFEPGARSAWHTHPAGQRPIVTAGVGRTGVWGGPVVEIKAGDGVWCPPGVKHWHGEPRSGWAAWSSQWRWLVDATSNGGRGRWNGRWVLTTTCR